MGDALVQRIFGPKRTSTVWERFYSRLTPEEQARFQSSATEITSLAPTPYGSPPGGVSEATWAQYQNLRREVGETGAPERPIVIKGMEATVPDVMGVGLEYVPTPAPDSPFAASIEHPEIELPTPYETTEDRERRTTIEAARAEYHRPIDWAAQKPLSPLEEPLTTGERQMVATVTPGLMKSLEVIGGALGSVVAARDRLSNAPAEAFRQVISNIEEGKPGAVAAASLALPIALGAKAAELAVVRPAEAALRGVLEAWMAPQQVLFGMLALGREAVTGQSVRGEHTQLGAVLDPLIAPFASGAHTLIPAIPPRQKGMLSSRQWLWGEAPSLGIKPPTSRLDLLKIVTSVIADMTLDPAYLMTFGVSGVTRIAGTAGTVALKKSAGRAITQAITELRKGTMEIEDLSGILRPFRAEIEPILEERLGRGAALLEAGASARQVEDIAGVRAGQKLENVLAQRYQGYRDAVIFGKKRTSEDGSTVYHYIDRETKATVELSQPEYELAAEIVRKNIDIGGIGIMLPGRAQDTRGWEFQRRTLVDAAKWSELAGQLKVIQQADMLISPRVYKWVAGPLSTFYNKYGRVELGLYRLNTTRQGRVNYLADTYRKEIEDVVRQNGLNSNQTELLMSVLDTGKSAADPTLEATRRRILDSPNLRLAYEQAKPQNKVVETLMAEGYLDRETAVVIATALRTGAKLEDPALTRAAEQFRPMFDDFLKDAQLYGIDLGEAVGGNYVPRRTPRKDWKTVQQQAYDESLRLDRQAGIEMIADSLSRYARAGFQYPRAPGGRQTAQFPRALYRWVGIDGDVGVHTAQTLAVKPVMLERVVASVTTDKARKVARIERSLVPLNKQLDALEEITKGRSVADIRTELAQVQRDLREANREFVGPAERSEAEMATLSRRREKLDHRSGVLKILDDMGVVSEGGIGSEPFYVQWRRTVDSVHAVEAELRGLGMTDDLLLPLTDTIRTRVYSRLDALEEARRMRQAGEASTPADFVRAQRDLVVGLRETVGRIKQGILDSDVVDDAASRGLEVSNREMARLLDQQRGLDKLEAITTQIMAKQHELDVLAPTAARDLRDRIKGEIEELQQGLRAAQSAVTKGTTKRQITKQITQLQNDIANRIEALMQRIPNQSDALFMGRRRLEARGMMQEGDRVIVASGAHEPSTISGHLYRGDDGEYRAIDLGAESVETLDESRLRYVVRNPDGTERAYARGSLNWAPDYGHLVFYHREKAYQEEIMEAFPGMFDPGIVVPAAQRAVEHAKMISDADFYNSLKELGWARPIGENPGGWVDVEFSPQLKGYVVSKKTREFLLDIWKADEPVKGVLGAMNRFNGWWKGTVTSLFPAFHGQNAISNVWLNFMDTGVSALNPAEIALSTTLVVWHRKAMRLEREATGTGKVAEDAQEALGHLLGRRVLTDRNGKEWTFGEFRETARKSKAAFTGRNMGLLDTDIPTNKELDRLAARQSNPSTIKRIGYAVVDVLANPGRIGAPIANTVEDVFRIQNWLVNLRKNGGDVLNAAERTNQFLIDYSRLTAFERQVLRPLIPFYTFSKSNLVLQTQMAFKRPGQVAFQAHLIDGIQTALGEDPLTDEEWARLPEYMQQGTGLVWDRGPRGVAIMNNVGLPLQHAVNTAMPWLKLGTFRDVPRGGGLGAAALALPLKGGIELASHYNLWLNRSMGGRVRIDGMGRFIDTLGPFGTVLNRWLRMEKTLDKEGNTAYYAHNVGGAYIAQNMPPISRVWSEAGRLGRKDTPLGPRLLEELLGFNYRQLTMNDLYQMERAFYRELRRETGIDQAVEDTIQRQQERYVPHPVR